ncbi:hypothetical protein GCM10018793_26290 [Streptomyces sulfonofaciens]|uniref:Glycosyltransferase RgtA/B/C/D-like domain-containing protein n=1 Tax=Streptomyces sulfonofaciens TaxID=68272 RepID=A0A919G5E3_9ACTN|nr:hypothetical protein [Streptomyces sulfonofaciens]GHH77656.1 hypothetical protein GCM10018793_26290 [Streptomyces sulfonofaciens]
MGRSLRRALPALCCYAAVRLVGLVVLAKWAHQRHLDVWPMLSSEWDSAWYLRIAEHGYAHVAHGPADLVHGHPDGLGRQARDLAFFPLYPMLVRALATVLPGPAAAAGVVLAVLASLVAAWGVFAVGDRLYGRRAGVLLTVLWAALPTGLVQWMGYTESLFTALAAWSLHAVLTGRWLWAGALAALCGLTRPTGVALATAVTAAGLVTLWRQWRAGATAARAARHGGSRGAVCHVRVAVAHGRGTPRGPALVTPRARPRGTAGRGRWRPAEPGAPRPEAAARTVAGGGADGTGAHPGGAGTASGSRHGAGAASGGPHGAGARRDAGTGPGAVAGTGAPGIGTGRHAGAGASASAGAGAGPGRAVRVRACSPRVLAGTVLAPAGWLGFLGWVGVRTGRWDGYFAVQRLWRNQWDGGEETWRRVRELFSHDPTPQLHLVLVTVTLLVSTVLFVLSALDRQPLPLLVFTGVLLAITLGSGGVYPPRARFLLPGFPLLLPAALVLARARPRWTALTVTAAVAVSAYWGAYMLLVWRGAP